MFLHGGLERSFHKAVKVMPGLSCRSQHVGNARAVGYLSRKAANRKWNQPNRSVAVNKDERRWRSKEYFDIRHGEAELVQLLFSLALVQYLLTILFPPFWNNNVYPVLLYVGSI